MRILSLNVFCVIPSSSQRHRRTGNCPYPIPFGPRRFVKARATNRDTNENCWIVVLLARPPKVVPGLSIRALDLDPDLVLRPPALREVERRAAFRAVVLRAVLRAVFRTVVLRAVFRAVVLRADFLAVVLRAVLLALLDFFAFAGAMLTKPLQTLLLND